MKTYTVKKGDTLWDISKRELGNANKWQKLHHCNYDIIGDDPDIIEIGQKIFIPKWKTKLYCLKRLEKTLSKKVDQGDKTKIDIMYIIQNEIETYKMARAIKLLVLLLLIVPISICLLS